MANLFGLYRGLVIDANDPEQRGRLKVGMPALGPDPYWAMPCVPNANAAASIAAPPDGSIVWIMFEGGDPNMPVWIGVLPKP